MNVRVQPNGDSPADGRPAGTGTRRPDDGRQRIPRPQAPSAPKARPRSAPHPFRVESLRGFAPWAGGGLILALGWTLAATSVQWQGSWGEMTEELNTAAGVIGVPFAIASGAWQGGRERRRRTTELFASTARTPLAQFLTAALPLACWLAGAYLVVTAGAVLACAPYASAGDPMPLVHAATALSLAACTVLGHTAGRVAPFRLTAPVLAICGYVAAGTLGKQPSNLRYLGLALLHVFGDDVLPVWWYPLLSALWAAGLATAAVLAHAAYRRATALLPLAAALGAAVLLVQTGDGLLRDNPLARQQVCDESTTPNICVNATYPGMLPEVTHALSGLTGRLKGVENLPVRYEDLWRDPHKDEAQLPNLTPFGWSVVRGKVTDPEQYAWEAAGALVRIDCEDLPPQRIQVTDDAVLRWLAPDSLSKEIREQSVAQARQQGETKELARFRAEDKAYAHLTAMTDDERRSWLSRYFATAQKCDPKASEVPSL
ncbi:hypothetical protein [Streptomyces sp. NBC_00203]|uniref:hypothetical protein n=1 Tax=Streptomyces sp. NBC_00203 TaxID=2975680 RepID=UPI0032454452